MRKMVLLPILFAMPAAAAEPPLGLDHAIIYAQPGAPEQEALKKAGFTIAPMINRDDGQGTSSVTVEFLNGFLDALPPAAAYAARDATVKFTVGNEWLMILTLDGGRQGRVRDLAPDLPLVVRY